MVQEGGDGDLPARTSSGLASPSPTSGKRSPALFEDQTRAPSTPTSRVSAFPLDLGIFAPGSSAPASPIFPGLLRATSYTPAPKLLGTPVKTPKPSKPSALKKRRNSPTFGGMGRGGGSPIPPMITVPAPGAWLAPQGSVPSPRPRERGSADPPLNPARPAQGGQGRAEEKVYQLQLEAVRARDALRIAEAERERETRLRHNLLKSNAELQEALEVLKSRVEEGAEERVALCARMEAEAARMRAKLELLQRQNEELKSPDRGSRPPAIGLRPTLSPGLALPSASPSEGESFELGRTDTAYSSPAQVRRRSTGSDMASELHRLQLALQQASLRAEELQAANARLLAERCEPASVEPDEPMPALPAALMESEPEPLAYAPNLLQQLEAPTTTEAGCMVDLRLAAHDGAVQTTLSVSTGPGTDLLVSLVGAPLRQGAWFRKCNRAGSSPKLRFVWMDVERRVLYWAHRDPHEAAGQPFRCRSVSVSAYTPASSWSEGLDISRGNGALHLSSRDRAVVLLPTSWAVANAWREGLDAVLPAPAVAARGSRG